MSHAPCGRRVYLAREMEYGIQWVSRVNHAATDSQTCDHIRQKAAALTVAVVVDFVQMGGWGFFGWGFLSPLEDGLDVLTAVILMAICGFKWQFVVAFFVELLPVADIFPTWTAMVLTLPTARATMESPRVEPAEGASRIHVEQVERPGEGPGKAGGGGCGGGGGAAVCRSGVRAIISHKSISHYGICLIMYRVSYFLFHIWIQL